MIEEEVEIGCSTTVTRYAYDGWNPAKMGATGTAGYDVWAVFNSVGSLTSRQLQGDGIDQHLAYVQGGAALWYLTDHLGSTRATINNSGTMQDSLTYDAYGNMTQSTPCAQPLYTYTGREFDVDTGLQYDRARWYDPNTGRWISQDPLGFDAGDSNLYRYVNNAPTIVTDPSGMQGARTGEPRGTVYRYVTSIQVDKMVVKWELFNGNKASSENANLNIEDDLVKALKDGALSVTLARLGAGTAGQRMYGATLGIEVAQNLFVKEISLDLHVTATYYEFEVIAEREGWRRRDTGANVFSVGVEKKLPMVIEIQPYTFNGPVGALITNRPDINRAFAELDRRTKEKLKEIPGVVAKKLKTNASTFVGVAPGL